MGRAIRSGITELWGIPNPGIVSDYSFLKQGEKGNLGCSGGRYRRIRRFSRIFDSGSAPVPPTITRNPTAYGALEDPFF
jgi:hypothetical protein